METTQSPTTLVIFGATGDLSRRKLLPALFDLFVKKLLPSQFYIVGFSRRDFSRQDFQAFVKEVLLEKGRSNQHKEVEDFLKFMYYQQGMFEDPNAYHSLGELLVRIDSEEVKGCANKLFYLAVPPASYALIFKELADSGLTIPCGGTEGWTPLEINQLKLEKKLLEDVQYPDGEILKRTGKSLTGWTRVLVEKPFGKDLDSSRELDEMLGLLFKEEQIFRIDHYLAKETLQNMLAFRFSNILFEPLWNRDYIESVEIKLWEQEGIEGRGAFYDGMGALRDVGQNHLLQMLALIAMGDPVEMDPQRIRERRAEVLEALEPITSEQLPERVARGQYAGYRDEKDVASDSQTETSFRIQAFLTTPRWTGVPFFLEAGKKMPETKTEISVYFKKTDHCLCPPGVEHRHQNVLTFRIQPDEGISVVFWAKKPGFATELEPQKLSFLYKDSAEERAIPDAYERILYDCIRGDQTLFASTEEVTAAWKFIMPIVEHWDSIGLKKY